MPYWSFIKIIEHLKKDIINAKKLISKSSNNTTSLGDEFYKTRIKNSDKNKDKSGGYRIITYFIDIDDTIYLASIYDKSKIDNITNKQLLKIIKENYNFMLAK